MGIRIHKDGSATVGGERYTPAQVESARKTAKICCLSRGGYVTDCDCQCCRIYVAVDLHRARSNDETAHYRGAL